MMKVAVKQVDQHGNRLAREGVDRCWCGSKYWEKDRCVDCKTHVSQLRVYITA